MIAVAEAIKAGLFRRDRILSNILAGTIVGIVALPLAMAFAIASGAKPEQGIFTAIIAALAVSLFGGSQVQIAGPTGAFIVILSSITAKFGYDGLQIAGLMAGVLLIIMGIARLGTMIKFIPYPVTTGFTAGIAIIIWVSQWKEFLGLQPGPMGEHFHQKLFALLAAIPTVHWTTTLLSAFALLLLIGAPRLTTRVPSPLVAMLAATALQSYFQFEGVATIGTAFGGIPSALPSFNFPEVSFQRMVQLIGPAFTIALLGSIESLLSAVVADGMTGTKHDSNQELVGQGIANILSPLFGGFAATGAIARTATNIKNGGTSPLAGIVHSVILLLIILILAPFAADIPLGALAAILFVVAYNMSEARHFLHLVRSGPRSDVAVLLTTFGLTVFADLVIAVNVGVVLASLLFMRRMADSVRVDPFTATALSDGGSTSAVGGIEKIPPNVYVYSIDGPFFFGAAETFERTMASLHQNVKVLVIRLGRVPFIDATAMHTLDEMLVLFRKRGTRVILCEMNERVRGKLEMAGLYDEIGTPNIFPDLESALKAAGKGPNDHSQ